MSSSVGMRWLAPSALRLDVDRLRTTLEELHVAVARPVHVTLSSLDVALRQDRRRIQVAVTEVLSVLDGVDLDARRALAGHLSRVQQEGADRLAGVLAELQATLRQRLRRSLGDPALATLRAYLARPAPDLLGVFGKSTDENAHSDVLAWLLSPRRAPTVAPVALARLVGCFDDAEGWRAALTEAIARDSLSVRRELTIGREWSPGEGLDRIDIAFSGPGFLLAVENKVRSSEHDLQTETYWRWLSQLGLRAGGIFLTPSGLAAASPEFKPVSYLELLSCLLEAPARGPISPLEEYVLVGYVKTLATSILRAESRSTEQPEARR